MKYGTIIAKVECTYVYTGPVRNSTLSFLLIKIHLGRVGVTVCLLTTGAHGEVLQSCKKFIRRYIISKTYSIDSLCMCETAHPENGSVRMRILRMAA